MDSIRKPATCHPEKQDGGKGLCSSCYRKQYYALNKEKMLLKGREYYQRTKEQKRLSGKAYRLRHPERGRNNQLKRLYGITLDDYKTMLEKQDYNCKFCNEPLDNRPVVDHNHTTGLVRGVIHQKCNILIGFFETNGHLFSNLESYLKDHHETEQA